MPSVQSLRQFQYYAHPQNSFWWIVSRVYGFPDTLSYAERCNELKRAGVAVWDVLYDCERPGSADSSIVKGSEVVNNFEQLFTRCPTLELVAFNGRAAEKLFLQYCKELVSSIGFQIISLPSTSPAHAAMSRSDKLRHWSESLLETKSI